MIWNETNRIHLYALKSRGRDFGTCAATLSDLTGDDIAVEDVVALWNAMENSGWIKAREAAKKKARNQKSKSYDGKEWQADRKALMEANIWHLVDLKRAGHSPTRTEFQISPEGKGVRYATVATSSYLGSSASACVDFL